MHVLYAPVESLQAQALLANCGPATRTIARRPRLDSGAPGSRRERKRVGESVGINGNDGPSFRAARRNVRKQAGKRDELLVSNHDCGCK